MGLLFLARARAEPSVEEVARQSQALSRTIMSPFCPGKTVDSCPSPKAGAWRRDIRDWVARGDSAEEIRARLQARAPDFDLAGRPGVGWDWVLPVGAMLLATLGLLLVVRRLRPRGDTPRESEGGREAVGERDIQGLDARIEAELDALE